MVSGTENSKEGAVKQIFVYQTLKSEKTVHEVVGYNLPEIAYVMWGWSKKDLGNGYDTIYTDKAGKVKGDVVLCTDEEIEKLKAWEDRYDLRPVGKWAGNPVFAFIIKGEFPCYSIKNS
jgi:gamma-glutamylcyclotransferase (GGCT)/AIG2-like uncharacterized protein YtfP